MVPSHAGVLVSQVSGLKVLFQGLLKEGPVFMGNGKGTESLPFLFTSLYPG